MSRIKQDDLEKMFGKMVGKRKLSIVGFKKKLEFEIYDGLAYCPDHEGHEYMMKYPRMSFINESAEAQDMIRKEIDESDEYEDFTILDVIKTFNEFYIDNKRVVYDKETNTYEEKDSFSVEY